MENIFILRENIYNLRNFQEIFEQNRKTTRYGLETISSRTPSLWTNLPNENTLATCFNHFKLKMKTWKFNMCVCSYTKKFRKI